MIRLYIDKIGSDCYDTDKKKTKEVLLKSLQRSGGSSPERRRNLRKAGTLQWELNRFISERDIERSCRCPFSFVLGLLTAPGIADRIRYGIDDYTNPSLTVDEPMSARIPRDNGISGTFLIVLKTLYAGATSKVF